MCELKSCPICGEPSIVFTLTDRQGIKHYGIACNSGHNPKEFYDTEAEAISAWNNEDYSKCTTCG